MVGCAISVGTSDTATRPDSEPLALVTAYATFLIPGEPGWSRVRPTSRLGSGSVWSGSVYRGGTTWMLVATRMTVTNGLSIGITESTGGAGWAWGPGTNRGFPGTATGVVTGRCEFTPLASPALGA